MTIPKRGQEAGLDHQAFMHGKRGPLWRAVVASFPHLEDLASRKSDGALMVKLEGEWHDYAELISGPPLMEQVTLIEDLVGIATELAEPLPEVDQ